MATEWMNADTGEEAPVDEIQPKRRGRPPKDTRTVDQVREDLGEEYVSPIRQGPARAGEMAPTMEETYAPVEEPPLLTDEEIAATAARIFAEDLVEVDPEFNPGYVLNEEGVPVYRGPHSVIARDERTIVDKLVAVMEAVEGVGKHGQNTAMGYGYQRAVDVFKAVRPEFIKQGLLFTTSVYKTSTTMIERGGGKSPNVLVEIEATFRVTDGREVVEITGAGAGIDTSGDKSIYKAITGAMKYGIRQLLMLPDENDPEKPRPGERDDAEGQQQQPVVITPAPQGSADGVQQGGRQTKATSVQVDRIRDLARGLNLTPVELSAFIVSVLGKGPDDDSNPGAIIMWLSQLSFEECGTVVQTLTAATQSGRE